MSPVPKTGLAEGLVIAVVAVACLVFQIWLPTTHVSEADYQAVAQVLGAEAQPGDVVLLSPWWTERARIYLPESVPVTGYLGSDHDALELHPRIWLLSQPSLPRSNMGEFMSIFGPQRTETGTERRFGNLSLRLFTNGRAKPVRFSATASLPNAKVYLEQRDGSRVPCQWTGRSHRCPNGGEVLPEWRELKYQPRKCLRFFPPGGGGKLVAEFEHVPAADSLVLMGGYIWEHAVHLDGVSQTDLGLEVNGQTSVLPLPPGTDGVQRVERRSTPEGANVRVWVTAANPNDREVCFELYGFGGATP